MVSDGGGLLRGNARQQGFTLVELMIVVVIIAVLSAIVYPSYVSHMVRTKRVAAEGCLSEYANFMERFYSTNLRYDKDADGDAIALPALQCAANSQTGGYYKYAFATGSPTAAAYELEATPQGAQATADAACGALSLTQAGTKAITGTSTVSDCW